MHGHPRRPNPAAARFAERREREDQAPRLASEVPSLASLKIEMEERSSDVAVGPSHTRHVVIDRAPALFFVPCGDPRCLDGGHDLTNFVMVALRRKDARFEVTDACGGAVGTGSCTRVLHAKATATYRP